MSALRLQPHGPAAGGAVRQIEVRVATVGSDTLSFRFELAGELQRLRIPAPVPVPGGRADELWRHTCFEAFVRLGEASGYLELNFSPSGQWQAYAFESYRDGMRPCALEPPRIALHAEAGRERAPHPETVALAALVRLPPEYLSPAQPLRLALSTVVEDEAGVLSYWALRHPAGRPDFHHPDAFALELARP